jgi:hypothetical protein
LIETLDEAGDSVKLRSRGIEEGDLISFLKDCKNGDVGQSDAKKVEAQQIVNSLSLVGRSRNRLSLVTSPYFQALDSGGLHQRKWKWCQKYLRRLCDILSILPQSFMLEPTFDERETEPFAVGGYSDVYKATINARPVAIKTLKVIPAAYRKVHGVSGLATKTLKRSLTPGSKVFLKEVIGRKWLQHDNILPFIGIILESPRFSIVSERMENGNIMDFVKARPNHNRLQLVSEGTRSILTSY